MRDTKDCIVNSRVGKRHKKNVEGSDEYDPFQSVRVFKICY